MDSELTEFIAHLDDDVPFSPYPQLNEMWRDLEDYFDRSYFNIDEYLDELLPSAQPASSTVEYDIPTNEPQMITTEKLFQSFAISETFFNNLIVHPPLSKDRNVVTNELLLNSVRSQNFTFTGRKCEHPFEALATTCVSSVAPLRKEFIADTQTTLVPSMPSNTQWYSVLQKQALYPGITAEVMAKNALQDESANLPAQTEIRKVIEILFTDLNCYMDGLSIEFGDNKFFDKTHFDDVSKKLQDKILSHSKVKANGLRDVLIKWMGMVTESFTNINDKRRQIEEKVSKKIIDKAVEIYRSRLKSLNLNDDNSIACKKERDIICQGIRHAYANCGETFTANVVSRLEKCFKNETSTTNEPKINRLDATVSNGFQVVIKLLASEYANNINQKGLRCAGISTLVQFDDVNGRCLKDIWHNFDRKMSDVPFAEQNVLKEQLNSMLNSESNCKRSEFKRSLKAAVPTGISSGVSFAKSHSVGIHFGFETFSVSYYDRVNNSCRTIYGPVANVVSFTRDGISIGLIPSDGRCLNMEYLLTNLTVDRLYDTLHYGKLKLESIIAFVLMYTHEIVQQRLHPISEIKYAVAIPSCLNDRMQRVFKTAFNIAHIDCQLIREQCALTTNFVREHHQAMTKNNDEFVVAMVVNEKNASDSIVYDISGLGHERMIKVSSAGGSEDTRKLLGFIGRNGVKSELDKIQSKCNRRARFLICCNDPAEIRKQIKNEFSKSKVHLLKFDSNCLAEGAALLSFVTVNGTSSLGCSFDLHNLTSIKQSSSVTYRLEHTTNNYSDSQNLEELSVQLRIIIDNQLSEIAESKAATKQVLVGKMKDMEESRLTEKEKKEYRRSLKNDLKAVDDELMNKRVIESIAENWKKNNFK